MSFFDDPNNKMYVRFDDKAKLIGIGKACEEIKQEASGDALVGGICYILGKIISLSPIIDNFIKIKELPPRNGIRRFEVINEAKNNEKKIVELRIGKVPGFPKSKEGVDIQVLMQYLKEEVKEVNIDLINKIKEAKNNKNFNFDEFSDEEKEILERILKKFAIGFRDFDIINKKKILIIQKQAMEII